MEPTASVKSLIDSYQRFLLAEQSSAEVATVQVDEIASKVAVFYEKIRKVIDWKEEHLIRRGGIERVLKRRLVSELSNFSLVPDLDTKQIAELLVLELIRGGHFGNGKIPRTKIAEVKTFLDKYIYLLEHNPLYNSANLKKKINLYNWVLELAACELEEILDFPYKEDLLITFMSNCLIKRIKIDPGVEIGPEEKKIQTFIAVHRALFNLDSPIIAFHLLKYHYPEWRKMEGKNLEEMGKNLLAVWDQIELELNHPLSNKFQKICEKYDTAYLILGDVLSQLSTKPKSILETVSRVKDLTQQTTDAYQKRWSTLKGRLFRAAIYSTLSVFVANGFSLFIVEVPIAKLVYGKFSPLALATDMLIPSLVMLFLVATIQLPKESNLKRVLEEIKKIIYPTDKQDVYEIRKTKKRGSLSRLIIGSLYAASSLFTLLVVFWIFEVTRVPWTSSIIDTFNIAMIVFAGLVVRQRAKELTIEEKGNFFEFFLDIISVPLAKLGQWLSNKWKEYNVVSIFLTLLIDTPIASLVEFIESWSTFLKEKKAEIH
ncbi:MAG: hypothetical protein ABID04_03090 [Patescibacteria group bacterium]